MGKQKLREVKLFGQVHTATNGRCGTQMEVYLTLNQNAEESLSFGMAEFSVEVEDGVIIVVGFYFLS